MFQLSRLSDHVRVAPSDFRKSLAEAIADEINAKYANKVLHALGLCIRLFDVLQTGDPVVIPGDGSMKIKVTFRLVVFRPFKDEVLVGKIRSCTNAGVHVTLGFFDDILLPADSLQPGSYFDAEEQVWIWKVGKDKLYMDVNEDIRFVVAREVFEETMPEPNVLLLGDGSTASPAPPSTSATTAATTTTAESKTPPYLIYGAANVDGLGMTEWWS